MKAPDYLTSLSMESNKSLLYNTLRTARISGSSVSGCLPMVFRTLKVILKSFGIDAKSIPDKAKYISVELAKVDKIKV